MNVIRRVVVLAGLVVAGAGFVSSGAATGVERHLRLVKSEPAADAVLEAPPSAIHLWFSEEPEVKVTTIQLTAAGKTLKLENVTADTEDGKHLVAAVDSARAMGAYTVAWRTMSKDGHVVSGEIAFQVRAVRQE